MRDAETEKGGEVIYIFAGDSRIAPDKRGCSGGRMGAAGACERRSGSSSRGQEIRARRPVPCLNEKACPASPPVIPTLAVATFVHPALLSRLQNAMDTSAAAGQPS